MVFEWMVCSPAENTLLPAPVENELDVRFIPFNHSSILKQRNFPVNSSTSDEDDCRHVGLKCDLPDARCSLSLVLMT